MTNQTLKARISTAVINYYETTPRPTRDGEAFAAAREALQVFCERMNTRLTPELNTGIALDALILVADVVREMRAHLTPQEQTDGEEARVVHGGKDQGLVAVRVCAPEPQGRDDGDQVAPADDAEVSRLQGDKGIAPPAVEALLKWTGAVNTRREPGRAVDAIIALREALRASLDREREMQKADIPINVVACCEHCDLPMVCPSAQAERIHGLEVMHAETLTRAEQAEQTERLTAYALKLEREHSSRVQTLLRQAEQERDKWREVATVHGESAHELATKLVEREAEIARLRERDYTAGFVACWGDNPAPMHHLCGKAFAAYLKAQTGSETP
jgi:hypothetical protein